jgi:hypothetical protein
MLKRPPSPSSDDDDDHDDHADEMESQDLLAPSQDVESFDSPLQHAQPFRNYASPQRTHPQSPVESTRQLSQFIHPPDDSDTSDNSDESVRYRRPRQRPVPLKTGQEEGYEENDDVREDVDDDDDEDVDDDVNADDDGDNADVATVADGGVGDGDSEGSMGTVVPETQLPYQQLCERSRRIIAARIVDPSCIEGIPPLLERIIRKSMFNDWGILNPHEFQIRAIHKVAFSRDKLLFLIAKTSSGKSAIPLTVGTLQTGITLSMVPLVGLGSDQVAKGNNRSRFVEAYHLYEHRGKDGVELRRRLMSFAPDEAEFVSINAVCLPVEKTSNPMLNA